MDNLTYKILQEISINSRISNTELSKKLQKPRHIILRRREKLYNDGYIEYSSPFINYRQLGYMEIIAYLKIHNYSKNKNEIINYISKIPSVFWASEITPNYSIRIVFLETNINDFHLKWKHVENFFGNNLLDSEIIISIDTLKISRFSTHEKKYKHTITQNLTENKKKLLHEISIEPLAPLHHYANKLNTSSENIRLQLKQLKESQILESIQSNINLAKMNKLFLATILGKVKSHLKYEKALSKAIHSDLAFSRVRETSGKWNIEINIITENHFEFANILKLIENISQSNFDLIGITIETERIIHNNMIKTMYPNI